MIMPERREYFVVGYQTVTSWLASFFDLDVGDLNYPYQNELMNDIYEVVTVNPQSVGPDEEAEVAEWLERPYSARIPLGDALSVMAQAAFIPAGEYLIEVMW